MIREYDAVRDKSQLRECVVQLQEDERRREPSLPEGEAMADDYLAFLMGKCAKVSGKLFVSEIQGRVVGFVGVFAEVPPEEPDEEQAPHMSRSSRRTALRAG